MPQPVLSKVFPSSFLCLLFQYHLHGSQCFSCQAWQHDRHGCMTQALHKHCNASSETKKHWFSIVMLWNPGFWVAQIASNALSWCTKVHVLIHPIPCLTLLHLQGMEPFHTPPLLDFQLISQPVKPSEAGFFGRQKLPAIPSHPNDRSLWFDK